MRMRAMRELPVAPIRRKVKLLRLAPNQWHLAPSRAPQEGRSRSSRTLSAGCDGRIGIARRATSKRTAKSCGPGAPWLALNLLTMIGRRR
jgi:hypothetical protein